MKVTQADLRLSGGQVLLPGKGLVEADLLIAGGRIAGLVSPGAEAAAAETVLVRGLALLPGAVDPHLHLGHGMDLTRIIHDPLRRVDCLPLFSAEANC